jgi:hypothetical protein
MFLGIRCRRWARDPHGHLLGHRLVKRIQEEEIELVAVVRLSGCEMLESRIGNGLAEAAPEGGGADTLALFAAAEELDNFSKLGGEGLNLGASRRWFLLKERIETARLKDPRDFGAIPERLDRRIRVTGVTHVDNAASTVVHV